MRVKQYKKILIVALSLCAVLLLGCVKGGLSGQLAVENITREWSKDGGYAQISAFFSEDAGITADQIMAVERSLTTALEEASQDVSDGNGRNWADCYSTEGQLTVSSEKSSVTARAFGIGNDFFLFHPLKLLDGNYFDGNDLNGDGVIIDENIAWQLFGSNHVSGMTVEIGGTVYPIRGVVRSDSGYFSKAAEEEKTTVYVSYGILQGDGEEGLKIDSYELLIRNPVQKFGYNKLKDALGLDDSVYEMVENSTRYGFLNCLNILKNFGARSMSTKNIVFPYWENRARAYEDVAALLTALQILLLIYPFFYACGKLHWLWKHKKELLQKAWHGIRTFAAYLPEYIKRLKRMEKPERKKKLHVRIKQDDSLE